MNVTGILSSLTSSCFCAVLLSAEVFGYTARAYPPDIWCMGRGHCVSIMLSFLPKHLGICAFGSCGAGDFLSNQMANHHGQAALALARSSLQSARIERRVVRYLWRGPGSLPQMSSFSTIIAFSLTERCSVYISVPSFSAKKGARHDA